MTFRWDARREEHPWPIPFAASHSHVVSMYARISCSSGSFGLSGLFGSFGWFTGPTHQTDQIEQINQFTSPFSASFASKKLSWLPPLFFFVYSTTSAQRKQPSDAAEKENVPVYFSQLSIIFLPNPIQNTAHKADRCGEHDQYWSIPT